MAKKKREAKEQPATSELKLVCRGCQATGGEVIGIIPPHGHHGILDDGTKYTQTNWTRFRCLSCGQINIVKWHSFNADEWVG